MCTLVTFALGMLGVYDMYNAKKGDGYPCFDELFHDCGGFAGHQDIFNVDVVRTGQLISLLNISTIFRLIRILPLRANTILTYFYLGLTTESTFSRLLKTGKLHYFSL